MLPAYRQFFFAELNQIEDLSNISGRNLVLCLSLFIGCAGREFAPKFPPYMYWYYPPELPAADRAVEAARMQERISSALLNSK
jgi:hypothetical protein